MRECGGGGREGARLAPGDHGARVLPLGSAGREALGLGAAPRARSLGAGWGNTGSGARVWVLSSPRKTPGVAPGTQEVPAPRAAAAGSSPVLVSILHLKAQPLPPTPPPSFPHPAHRGPWAHREPSRPRAVQRPPGPVAASVAPCGTRTFQTPEGCGAAGVGGRKPGRCVLK